MMNSMLLKFNFSKTFSSLVNINRQSNLMKMVNSKNFSTSLTPGNPPVNTENELSVREKVIKSLDYKKIFKKRCFHRNFDVENTLGQFESLERRDEQEMAEVLKKKLYNKEYLKVHNDWQKRLLGNKIRKGIIKHNFENYQFPAEQEEKFVVHNVEKALTLPAPDEKLFAVIEFKGLQHKVLKDDRVMLEKIDLQVGETFVFDKVLLVASDEYTSIGRPYVSTCKVLAIVEENTKTEKVITFKKKRRKGYQRNMGHRQDVTMIRILKVIHNPKEETLDNYAQISYGI